MQVVRSLTLLRFGKPKLPKMDAGKWIAIVIILINTIWINNFMISVHPFFDALGKSFVIASSATITAIVVQWVYGKFYPQIKPGVVHLVSNRVGLLAAVLAFPPSNMNFFITRINNELLGTATYSTMLAFSYIAMMFWIGWDPPTALE